MNRTSGMQTEQKVAVFWDFETSRVKSHVSGYQVAKGLREVANTFGLVKSIRTYLDVASQVHPGFASLRRELHASGVSIVDCPSSSSKDVADKAMIVDMLALVMDETPPSTIVIATGDRDLSYALAILRLRRFKIVLVSPPGTHESLLMQADDHINWNNHVLGLSDNDDSSSSSSESSSSPPSSSSPSNLSYASPNSTRHGPRKSTGPSTGPINAQVPRTPIPTFRPSVAPEDHVRKTDNSWPGWDHKDSGVATLSATSTSSRRRPAAEDSTPASEGPTASATDKPVNNITPSPALSSTKIPPSTTNVKSRVRAGTFPTAHQTPPLPSLPLEETDPSIKLLIEPEHDPPTKRTSLSPQSSEGFSIIDHPGTELRQPRENEQISTPPDIGTRTTVISSPTIAHANPQTALDSNSSLQPAPATIANSQTILSSASTTQPPRAVNREVPHAVTNSGPIPTATSTTPAPASTSINSIIPLPAPTTTSSPYVLPAAPMEATRGTGGAATTPVPTNPIVPPATTLPKTTPPTPPKQRGPHTIPSKVSTVPDSPRPKRVPQKYHALVRRLQYHRQQGDPWPNQSQIAGELLKENPGFYKTMGIKKWSTYASMAAGDGLIRMKDVWISLEEDWVNAVMT